MWPCCPLPFPAEDFRNSCTEYLEESWGLDEALAFPSSAQLLSGYGTHTACMVAPSIFFPLFSSGGELGCSEVSEQWQNNRLLPYKNTIVLGTQEIGDINHVDLQTLQTRPEKAGWV